MTVLLNLPGVPLPLIGMAAYGLVVAISLKLSGEDFPLGIKKSDARLVLLGFTTSMAAASAYFLYILTTKFSGSFCSYCLLSALLSFTLFFITAKVHCVYIMPFLLSDLLSHTACCLIGCSFGKLLL